MTTILQFIPQWLRSRLQRPAPQQTAKIRKKARQVLPLLTNAQRPPIQQPENNNSVAHWMLWRL